MTDEPRPPIFGFIFAPKAPTPGAPQIRWMRIPPRGPWRLALLILTTLATASLAGSALLGLAGIRTPQGLAIAAAVIVTGLPVIAVLVRGWIHGTYVNDFGVRIVRMWSTRFVPWSAIEEISESGRRRRHLVLLAEGRQITTTIGDTNLDTALRPQAWESAADRLRTWHREAEPPKAG